jgi:cell division septum initiation protein DivIVA
VLSQDHDADARLGANDHRDDASGVVVPEPRAPFAARLLEMTARETDQWRSEARAEAAEIVASARQEAETLLRTSQREATSMLEDARAEADGVRAESARQRTEAEAEVARLEQITSDHESRLRRHFREMLEQLDR